MATALIDGDIVAYRFACAAETPIDWGDGQWSLSADANGATSQIKAHIDEIVETLRADRVIVALSCGGGRYWRNAVLPTYKQNRKDVRKPMCLKECREYIEQTWETWTRPLMEADDVLGILTTSKKIIPGIKVLVSPDKDFLSVPGQLYNPGRADLGVIDVSPAYADFRHLFQTLTGDATDGFGGCPKVGPVKAEKLLRPFFSEDDTKFDLPAAWAAVVQAFEKAGLTEADALVQARVARICRVTDYDFIKKEVKLWTPPNASA